MEINFSCPFVTYRNNIIISASTITREKFLEFQILKKNHDEGMNRMALWQGLCMRFYFILGFRTTASSIISCGNQVIILSNSSCSWCHANDETILVSLLLRDNDNNSGGGCGCCNNGRGLEETAREKQEKIFLSVYIYRFTIPWLIPSPFVDIYVSLLAGLYSLVLRH